MLRALAALVLVVAFASADIGVPGSTTTSTTTSSPTTTTSSSTTATTAVDLPTTLPSATDTSTTSTSTTTTTSTTAPPSSSSSTPVGAVESDGPEPAGPQVLPPGAQAVIDSVVRTPPNSTDALLAALQPLVDAGMPQAQAIQLGFGNFPVGGPTDFSDD